jgi:hypothetical protein
MAISWIPMLEGIHEFRLGTTQLFILFVTYLLERIVHVGSTTCYHHVRIRKNS